MIEYAIEDLARRVNGHVVGKHHAKIVTGVAALGDASGSDLSFFVAGSERVIESENRLDWLTNTQAGAVMVTSEYADLCPVPAIVVDNPRASFATLAALWEQNDFYQGKHPSVVIGSDCSIPDCVSIGPGVIIADRVVMGDDCQIGAGAVIESDVNLGQGCQIHPRAVIRRSTIMGERCIIRAGAVIGEDGFGFEADAARVWQRVPQLGRVVLGSDVDVGAMSAIDRGALGDTVLKDGVKCDNLVQIGHNVVIEEHCLICGCVGIAGSTHIGKHCILGGGSRINGHLTLAAGTIVAGASAVEHSTEKPGVYAAFLSAEPHVRWKRILVGLKKLPEILRDMRALARRVQALEQRK